MESAAEAGQPWNFVSTGNQLDAKCGKAITATDQDADARYRHQQHGQVEQAMPCLGQLACHARVHHIGTLMAFDHRPDDTQHSQQQQQGTDGHMPGNQRLTHPVLAIVDAVKNFQQLPDDQKSHAPMQPAGNRTVTLLGITIHRAFLFSLLGSDILPYKHG